MRHLSLTLLGFLLVLPLGCSGKTEEDKTEDKTEAAENESKTKQSTSNTTANNNNSNSNASSGDPSDAFALVPNGTKAMWSVTPSALLSSSFFQAIPKEDDFERGMAEMKNEIGFDVSAISRVTVALWPGDGHIIPELPKMLAPQPPVFNGGPGEPNFEEKSKFDDSDFNECNVTVAQPGGGGGGFEQMIMNILPKFDGALYVQFNQDVDLEKLRSLPPFQGVQETEADGRKILLSPAVPLAGGVAVHQPNPRSLVVTFKDDLAELFSDSGSGPMVSAAKTHGADADAMLMLDFVPFQSLIQMGAGLAGGQVPGADQVLPQLAGISAFVDLNDGVDLDVMLDAKDEETIKKIKSAFDENYQGAGAQVGMAAENAPPGTSEETKALIDNLAKDVYESAKAEANGKQFHLSVRVPASAVEVIKKLEQEQKARMSGINNLKQIGIACHIYHDAHEKFPFPNGEEGSLSWRVHILPYVEQRALYEQFHLDEAWDSDHNMALLEKMPEVFEATPGTKPGHTQFVAPEGSGYLVDGDARRSFRDITDGSSNTAMVVSLKPENAVPWTKPGGYKIDPAKAKETLGWMDGKFLTLFADGSAHRLSTDLSTETLKGILTVSGGETVNYGELYGDEFGETDALPEFDDRAADEVETIQPE